MFFKKDKQACEKSYKDDPEFIEKRNRLIDWVKSNNDTPTLDFGSFKRNGKVIMEKRIVGNNVLLCRDEAGFDSMADDEIAVGMIIMREKSIREGNENKPVEFFGPDHTFERVKRIAIDAGIEVVHIRLEDRQTFVAGGSGK